jgi:hypothetical protein
MGPATTKSSPLSAFEKVLKAAVTVGVVSAVVSPTVGCIVYMFLGLGVITLNEMFCQQPPCYVFFYLASCSLTVTFLLSGWFGSGEFWFLGLMLCTCVVLSAFLFLWVVFGDRPTLNPIFAPGTDLQVTRLFHCGKEAFIVHSNVVLNDRQNNHLREVFSRHCNVWKDLLIVWAVQFVEQQDGTCLSRVSAPCFPRKGPRKGRPLAFTYYCDIIWDADKFLSERPLAGVVWILAMNWLLEGHLEEYAFERQDFFMLATWWLLVCPRFFLDDIADPMIRKACATFRMVPKLLLSWSCSVYRGARGCGKIAWKWTSSAAPKVLRWCACGALACAATAVGVCVGVAVYTAVLAALIRAVLFAVWVASEWRNLDEASRSSFYRAALFVAAQRLACVRAVRCGVASAVSGGASMLQTAARTLTRALRGIVSFVAAPTRVVAVGAVTAAALPSRALVLSVRAVARAVLVAIRNASAGKIRAAQSTCPRCDLEVVDSSDREESEGVLLTEVAATVGNSLAESGPAATETPRATAVGGGVVAEQPTTESSSAGGGQASIKKQIKHNPGFRALARQIFQEEKAARSDATKNSVAAKRPSGKGVVGASATASASARPRRSSRLLAKH